MTSPILSIQHLHKGFGEKKVLQDINLSIARGEIFGILGTNGSGKSTLLNTIINYYKPQQGSLHFDDKPYEQISDIKRKFGMATQDCSFYPNLTVFENVLHFARLHGGSKKDHENNILATLKLLNLEQHKDELTSNLSGGMQRRVDIACAMAHSPSILLLDEPTANLDLFLRKEMLKLITMINKAGVTVIVASHILSELEQVCHRVAVINEGKVVQVGAPQELLYNSPVKHKIYLETASQDYDKLLQKLGKYAQTPFSFLQEGSKLIIMGEQIEELHNILITLLARQKEHVLSLDVKNVSLEELFAHIIQEKKAGDTA